MSKKAYDHLIKTFSRAFFEPIDIVFIDYLCANGGSDQE